MIDIGEQTGGIYSLELQDVVENVMTTLEVSGEIFRVWYSLISHADRTAIKGMMVIKAVIGLDKGATAYKELFTMS